MLRRAKRFPNQYSRTRKEKASRNVRYTDIPEVIVLAPKVFGDDRGFFFESFNARTFERIAGELFDLKDWKIDVHAVG